MSGRPARDRPFSLGRLLAPLTRSSFIAGSTTPAMTRYSMSVIDTARTGVGGDPKRVVVCRCAESAPL